MKLLRYGQKGFTISELIIVFAVVLVICIPMVPFIAKNRNRLDKVICANNVRELGLAMYIYAREHEGKFPATIRTLYEEQYLSDTKLLDCPASKVVGTLDSPDYAYTPGLSVRSPSQEPLLRDGAKNHPDGGRNTLYVNGNVAWELE